MGKTESTYVKSKASERRTSAQNRAYYAARSLRYDARESASCINGTSDAELCALRTLDAYAYGRR